MIDKLMLGNEKFMTFNDLKKACADIDESFEMLWYSKEIDEIRYKHLLAIQCFLWNADNADQADNRRF